MRWMKWTLFTLLLLLFVACAANNDTEPTKDAEEHIDEVEEGASSTDSVETSQSEDQAYMEEKLANSYFYEVEIDISYKNDVDYEAEIDFDDGRYEAKIDDEVNGSKLSGLEAFDIIYQHMEELALSPTSDRDEVAAQIIDVFDLPEDYTELEIKVDFHNGSSLKLEKKNKQ